jgi:hypothetical protein
MACLVQRIDRIAPAAIRRHGDARLAASLGIVKGKPFQPDAKMKALLNAAGDAAFKMAAVDFFDTRYPNKLVYADRNWEVTFLGGSPVFRKDSYLDFDAMINFFAKAYLD